MTRISPTIVNSATKRVKAIILLVILLLSVSPLSARQWVFSLTRTESGVSYRLTFDDVSWKVWVERLAVNKWVRVYEKNISQVFVGNADNLTVEFDGASNVMMAQVICDSNGGNREIVYDPIDDTSLIMRDSNISRNFLQELTQLINWVVTNHSGDYYVVKKADYLKSQNTTPAKSTGQSSAAPVSNGNDVLTFNVKGVSFEMVKVDGGSFMMGSEVNSGSQPVHRENIATFYIGRTEVTQALWEAVMGNNPSTVKGANLPVSDISWNESQEFIHRLNQLTGRQFRLPTEPEWEYAARGGNRSQGYLYSGSNDPDAVAWYVDNSGGKPHPVGQKQPNELGIYDMSGNLVEYTSSYWSVNYSTPKITNRRVARGGTWAGINSYQKVTDRGATCSETDNNHFRGLRLAL